MLTIDNTDGALPIEFAEVTISRIMFRNGGSEYAINGEPCRLLDVQELLSDSGIGREMHVIVGQGQLDAVLAASPEERRGFIEEAAGVLKHRKRKEKALRKLDAMQANLTRVTDLTTELRRQLKPLGKQAEVARRAGVVQADLRDARLRLLADDLRAAAVRPSSRRSPTRPRCASGGPRSSTGWPSAQAREAELEAAIADAGAGARQGPGDLVPAVRRCASGCAAPRRSPPSGCASTSSEPDDDDASRDPASSTPRLVLLAPRRSSSTGAGRAADAEALAAAVAVAAREAEQALVAEERSGWPRRERAAADRREGLARLTGQVNAARSRVETGEAEIGRLAASLAGRQGARGRARRRSSPRSRARSPGSTRASSTSTPSTRSQPRRSPPPRAAVDALREQERDAERERAGLVGPARGARARA